MLKGRTRFIALLLAVLLTLAACGGQPTGSPGNEYGSGGATTEPTTAPPAQPSTGDELQVDRSRLSSELRFFNWTDYVDPSILEDFEKEYGVKVIVDLFDANEDMLAKVRAGRSGYDIVTPSDYAVEIMWRDGLIAKLDKSLLPNLKNIDPDLLNKYFDPGNVYSVPYMYGITGIAYNRQSFPNGVESWAVLFDTAEIARYRGQFSMLDDERETPGAALKFLGYSLNETSPEALKKAQDLLIAQKPFLAGYNSSDVNRKLASGEYVIAHAWSGSALQARNGLGDEFSGNPDIAFVIPKEGGMIWMDNMVILADSPNAYTAHVFMNFLMRPDIAARNAEYIGYLSPNVEAIKLLPQEIIDLYNEGFAPNDEVLKRLEWAIRNDQTAAFTDLWTAVKGE
ncbi:ABC transporter substrate-binding protein [Roseiflexus castenholzii]|jgi:spermidine/putrescine transport system substrate-binding protein|uniref:Extracellular solute-binding protein family 1 n=1 Tax=Roseiflexus castenholzii (strain DSM 13941 / HLO8) TaxID=383372 RepID=A7NMX9_ROSCS|nr:spermidine/putrescine ABC transporter substrate-binding protein [Roseiflexus castenholzii]ABU58908.1 extracellular solute-binding protein family 1 [Roseiflexus castenholzii DSM 13941]